MSTDEAGKFHQGKNWKEEDWWICWSLFRQANKKLSQKERSRVFAVPWAILCQFP